MTWMIFKSENRIPLLELITVEFLQWYTTGYSPGSFKLCTSSSVTSLQPWFLSPLILCSMWSFTTPRFLLLILSKIFSSPSQSLSSCWSSKTQIKHNLLQAAYSRSNRGDPWPQRIVYNDERRTVQGDVKSQRNGTLPKTRQWNWVEKRLLLEFLDIGWKYPYQLNLCIPHT